MPTSTSLTLFQNNKKSELEKLKTENVNLYLANDTISDVIKKLNDDIDALKSRNEKLEGDLQDLATLQQRNTELVTELQLPTGPASVTECFRARPPSLHPLVSI